MEAKFLLKDDVTSLNLPKCRTRVTRRDIFTADIRSS